MNFLKKTVLAACILPLSALAAPLLGSQSPKLVIEPEAIISFKVPITDQERQVPRFQKPDATAVTAGGAWSGTAYGPTVYQRNSYYATPVINPIGPVTNANTTTTVYYTWSTSYKPTNLSVYLCNYARCVNISGFQNFSTTAFSGDIANSQFIFYFYVAGTGLLQPPMYGSTNQVIVNFQ